MTKNSLTRYISWCTACLYLC